MSITITTINNEAAVPKTFTKVGNDRGTSEYYNSSDATNTFDSRLFIKQQIVGKQNGIPQRRSLVQSVITVADLTSGVRESFTANLTLTGPIQLQNLTTTNRKDALAFIRNLVTATVEEQLAFGEL